MSNATATIAVQARKIDNPIAKQNPNMTVARHEQSRDLRLPDRPPGCSVRRRHPARKRSVRMRMRMVVAAIGVMLVGLLGPGAGVGRAEPLTAPTLTGEVIASFFQPCPTVPGPEGF